MKLYRNISVFVSFCLFYAVSNAQTIKPIEFKVVQAESHVKFEAKQAGVPINGEFKSFTADISFHPDNLAESKVRAVIDMSSFAVDSSDAQGVLSDATWFNTKLFPQSIFETKSFKPLGENKYEADGELEIKGHKEPINFIFTLDEFNEKNAHIKGNVTLKRRNFDIGEERTDSIEDGVVVSVEIKAVAR